MRYVYSLTAFVCFGAFLFGWNQGVMSMIIADDRWLDLMQSPNECELMARVQLFGGITVNISTELIRSTTGSVGFVVSVYNIGCAIGAMNIGLLADEFGRERTLSLASIVFVIGALIQAASNSIRQIVSNSTFLPALCWSIANLPRIAGTACSVAAVEPVPSG